MMSQKSSKVKRSRIPRFQGSIKKVSVVGAKEVISKHDVLKESVRTNVPIIPDVSAGDCNINKFSSSVGGKNGKLIDIGDVPFEPDNQALDSILTNRGILPGQLVRASLITSRPSAYRQQPENRMSLWESYNEFKENVKLYREKTQQYENSTHAKLTPKTPDVKLNDKGTAITPLTGKISSSYDKSKWSKMSLLDLYNEDKENVKIFREKMHRADCALQTPSTPSNQHYNPTLNQDRPVVIIRNLSTVTPKHKASFKAWTESKENKGPTKSNQRTAVFSTSKKQSRHFRGEASSLCPSSNGGNTYFPAKPVKRFLLPSLNENEDTERRNDEMRKDTKKIAGYEKLNQATTSLTNGNPENTSVHGSSTTSCNMPLFSSSGCIQSLHLLPLPSTPRSFLSQGSLKSSTECTWSFEESLSTPVYSGCGILKNAPTLGTKQIMVENIPPSTNKQLLQSGHTHICTVLKSNDRAADNAKNTPGYPNISKSTLNTQSKSLPSLSLIDPFSRLHLTPISVMPQKSCIHTSSLQNQYTSPLQQETMEACGAFSPTLVAYFSAKMPSTSSEAFLYSHDLPAKPQPQVVDIFPKDQRTHLSSALYAHSGLPVIPCLKSRENVRAHSTECLSAKNAVTSAKKLRWADSQKEDKDF